MRRSLRAVSHSLRGRLFVGTLVWILVTAGVAGWGLNGLFRQHLERQLASELRVYMNQLVAGLSVDENENITFAIEPSDPRFEQPLSGLYWQANKFSGSVVERPVVAHSRSLRAQTLRVSDLQTQGSRSHLTLFDAGAGAQFYGLSRVVTPAEGQARYQLTVAANERLLIAPLKQFTRLLMGALAVLVLGMIAATIMQLWLGLKPLISLRRELTKVRTGSERQILGRYPSEIQPLVDEFNQVLRSNDEIVQRARTQAGNLAHALKTPLSVLANAAQQNNDELALLVDEQVSQARRHVDYHLAWARAASVARTPGMFTPVEPVMDGLVRTLKQLYRDKGVELHLAFDAPKIAFQGGAHDLQEILGNVLDNACKWATQQVWVRLFEREAAEKRWVVVCIEDDGPGLAQSDHARVFQRGTRLDEQIPGSGLGLSIVHDLVQSYGGQVSAYTSGHGGLGVELTLPAALSKSLKN